MSKRAKQKALEEYPVQIDLTACDCDINEVPRDIYQEGYEQAKEDFIALVKQYLEKGERCMEQVDAFQMYPFWDGFHNCAENILRELDGEQ